MVYVLYEGNHVGDPNGSLILLPVDGPGEYEHKYGVREYDAFSSAVVIRHLTIHLPGEHSVTNY